MGSVITIANCAPDQEFALVLLPQIALVVAAVDLPSQVALVATALVLPPHFARGLQALVSPSQVAMVAPAATRAPCALVITSASKSASDWL